MIYMQGNTKLCARMLKIKVSKFLPSNNKLLFTYVHEVQIMCCQIHEANVLLVAYTGHPY